MSKSPLRTDKTCLNCNYVVENRYCPNCGQENTETRKTFHHLFVHFFEDLTHYENAFWKTIRNLITKPGSLTREYLSGKRMSYLAPFRLYIFISFVTFFVIAMLPEEKSDENIKFTKPKNGIIWTREVDSVRRANDSMAKKYYNGDRMQFSDTFFQSQRELDSVQKFSKPEDRLTPTEYWIASKFVHVVENNTRTEIKEKFLESFSHNFPKVLFIYMPCFAFVLWLFQSKKRWYYFDHGIFTLHYFSFLLLGWLIFSIATTLMDFIPDNAVVNVMEIIIEMAMLFYMFYYFFPAHHRFYEEKRRWTVIKGMFMLFINSFFAGLIMLAFIVYTFINIK